MILLIDMIFHTDSYISCYTMSKCVSLVYMILQHIVENIMFVMTTYLLCIVEHSSKHDPSNQSYKCICYLPKKCVAFGTCNTITTIIFATTPH